MMMTMFRRTMVLSARRSAKTVQHEKRERKRGNGLSELVCDYNLATHSQDEAPEVPLCELPEPYVGVATKAADALQLSHVQVRQLHYATAQRMFSAIGVKDSAIVYSFGGTVTCPPFTLTAGQFRQFFSKMKRDETERRSTGVNPVGEVRELMLACGVPASQIALPAESRAAVSAPAATPAAPLPPGPSAPPGCVAACARRGRVSSTVRETNVSVAVRRSKLPDTSASLSHD
jgi:hypothetical protein